MEDKKGNLNLIAIIILIIFFVIVIGRVLGWW